MVLEDARHVDLESDIVDRGVNGPADFVVPGRGITHGRGPRLWGTHGEQPRAAAFTPTPLRLMLIVRSVLQLVPARLTPMRPCGINMTQLDGMTHAIAMLAYPSWTFRVVWRSRSFLIWFIADRDRMDRMDRMLLATGRLV
jgi:hypothetical protein